MSCRSNSDLSYPDSGSENETADSDRRHGKRNRPVCFSDDRRRRSGRIREPAVDLFAALPDSLLVHLLSFLPIHDAIKTQVLSKRWKYLWTYMTSLVFRIYDSMKSDDDFVAFVDRTLIFCNCSKIKKFGVQFVYELEYDSNADLWIQFATARGVEEFQLDFDSSGDLPGDSDYLLPQLLYTNSSFKALQFNQCNLMPEGLVCWNSLKKLSIGNVELSDDLIQNILAGSPVLEILELYYFYGLNRLLVSNANVKKLILRDFWEEVEIREEYRIDGGRHSLLEISAPHLHLLEISGCLSDKICRLGDVSSLVDAKLNFDTFYSRDRDYSETYENMLKGLLQSLVHVKKITLFAWAIKVLSIMEVKGLRSPLLKCECLTLDMGIRKSLLPGIAHMLECSPNLETLVISVPSSSYHEVFPDKLCKFDGKNYWTSRKKAFTCLVFRLQKVRFLGFRHYNAGNKLGYYLSFVQFLLKNARVLQKMVINAQMVGCNSQKEFSRASQKLLSFPRSSPDAVVLFCK